MERSSSGNMGGNQGLSVGLNNSGQVIGLAANTIPDPFSLGNFYGLGWATQTRSFLWQHGVMRDLGTLGGPDALAGYVNERGQVTGLSYLNSTPNDTNGSDRAPIHLGERQYEDLGSLGTLGFPNAVTAGDKSSAPCICLETSLFHPFLWERGMLTTWAPSRRKR